jgi:hypothetical protein
MSAADITKAELHQHLLIKVGSHMAQVTHHSILQINRKQVLNTHESQTDQKYNSVEQRTENKML